ncbi:MAG: 4Fe-4S dicluster domain-containing protein [Desulfomonilaceae bacterium]
MKFWRLPLDSEVHSIPRGSVHIVENRCKGCGFCIEFCPNGCLRESKRFNTKGYHPPEVLFEAEDCVDCGLCSLICPEFAIYTELKAAKKITEADIQKVTTRYSRKDKRFVKG